MRNGCIQYTKTKSSKNRAVPITDEMQEQILATMPFGDCYKRFSEGA